MFKVILLICAVHTHQSDCQVNTALSVLQGPDASNEVVCGMQSQAYLADTALAATLTENEYLKIRCVRTGIGRQSVG